MLFMLIGITTIIFIAMMIKVKLKLPLNCILLSLLWIPYVKRSILLTITLKCHFVTPMWIFWEEAHFSMHRVLVGTCIINYSKIKSLTCCLVNRLKGWHWSLGTSKASTCLPMPNAALSRKVSITGVRRCFTFSSLRESRSWRSQTGFICRQSPTTKKKSSSLQETKLLQ